MSCVVGLKTDEWIYMGSDSAVSIGSTIMTLDEKDSKVFILKNEEIGQKMIIGSIGSSKKINLLRFYANIPPQKTENDYEYICTTFFENLKKISKKHLGNKKLDTFLLGYRDTLYDIGSGLDVSIQKNEYMARGAGDDFALGSLKTTEKLGIGPKKRIRLALESACFSKSVCGPFIIKKIKII